MGASGITLHKMICNVWQKPFISSQVWSQRLGKWQSDGLLSIGYVIKIFLKPFVVLLGRASIRTVGSRFVTGASLAITAMGSPMCRPRQGSGKSPTKLRNISLMDEIFFWTSQMVPSSIMPTISLTQDGQDNLEEFQKSNSTFSTDEYYAKEENVFGIP